MKTKFLILSVLLLMSLATVAFITVKYVHTVKSFNTFYELARETSIRIDSETADLEAKINSLQADIDLLQTELYSVTQERDQLAQQLSGIS